MMAAREDELVRRAMRLGELAAIRSEEYAAAVQRLRGGDGGTCRLIGNWRFWWIGCVRILAILVDRHTVKTGDFSR